MPAKYSHVKKRPPKKSPSGKGAASRIISKEVDIPNIHADRKLSQHTSPMAQLERSIAQILLIRFEQDIARLFSTHIYNIALTRLPTFILRCLAVAGPGWVAVNADDEEIKDFFRAALGMDLRQAGERVATKSILWSYTALRHFATSNNVPICRERGLHTDRLLPHYSALKAHLDTLQASPPPVFTKPPHLGPLTRGYRVLEDSCARKYNKVSAGSSECDSEWREKIRLGYERLTQTLWQVAREFDVRGYGTLLRDKLSSKWCDCGCSSDHLSEVCEKTVKEERLHTKVRSGKEKEWDGRGSGVHGWATEEEEDIWEIELNIVSPDPEAYGLDPADSEMTIGELMEWRYIRAEREKEQGNAAFKRGEYDEAIERYAVAHQIEPEMPHYNLNLAAAYLKINEWVKAEKACDLALSQHRSVKGHWRRAQARKAQGRVGDATKDLRAILDLQPDNSAALAELDIIPPKPMHQTRQKNSPLPRTNIGGSSTSFSSSSSSTPLPPQCSTSARTSRQSENDQRPSTTPEPFTRTYQDNFKLKISSLAVTIDVPVDLPPPFSDAKASNLGSPLPPADSIHTKLEAFTYPSWERYVIEKVKT